MSAAAAAPKVKKATKPKAPAAHPKYSDMVVAAIKALKERTGSSRQAIVKYIQANYKVGDNCNQQVKLALRKMGTAGTLKHSKGTGASGSFKVGEEKKPKAAKKPAAKKAKKPKAAKKPAAKKAAKSPKKASKPKKAKSPAKKAAAKPKKAAAKKPAKKAAKSPKKTAKKTAKKAAKK